MFFNPKLDEEFLAEIRLGKSGVASGVTLVAALLNEEGFAGVYLSFGDNASFVSCGQ